MNIVTKSVKYGFAAAVLVVVCWALSSRAGSHSNLGANGVGDVWGPLGRASSTTNKALTGMNQNQPSAGVTGVGTWTAQVPQPSGSATYCTSTVATVFLTGGYKALASSFCVSHMTADASQDLIDKLASDRTVVTPSPCGAGYTIASGKETNNDGQHYVVLLGNGTGGTAVLLQGYVFDGIPTSDDDVKNAGTNLYSVLVLGPFNFGSVNSTDRCDALKIPINYTGTNLFMMADAGGWSTTDLGFVGCPSPNSIYTLASCNPVYPAFQTTGGCGPVTNITYNPASATSFAPGTGGPVTETATDAAGNFATCSFNVFRPALQFTNCPTTPLQVGCSGTIDPGLKTSGGCAPVTITYSPALNALSPGNNNVIATATDAQGNHAICPFTAVLPFLNLGPNGFANPINGIGGTCTVPLRQIVGAGTKLQIKFTTYLCNTIYISTTPPTVTITKLDANCNPTAVEVNQQQLSLTSNTYHIQWQTGPNDVGPYMISVNLGDGNPNPISAIVQLTQ